MVLAGQEKEFLKYHVLNKMTPMMVTAVCSIIQDFADQQVREDRESRWISPSQSLPGVDPNADKYYKNQSGLVVVWVDSQLAFARYHHDLSEWIIQGFNGRVPEVIKWMRIDPPKI